MEAHERIIELLESVVANLIQIRELLRPLRVTAENPETEKMVSLSRVRELRQYLKADVHTYVSKNNVTVDWSDPPLIVRALVIRAIDERFPELKEQG